MVEPISAAIVASETAKATIAVKEVLAESLKETAFKETPLKSVLSEIENSSLETMKAQNELDINTSKEAKISQEVLTDSLKETASIEAPVTNVLSDIENSSLETLKARNELATDTIKEAKISQIEQNRESGALRQDRAIEDIQKEFPESEGYRHHQETYLRNEQGDIVKDELTGEARRVDLMVEKDGKIFKSVEVTSETAPKVLQLEKEDRIKENGGRFIVDFDTGRLVEIPPNVHTEIRRYK